VELYLYLTNNTYMYSETETIASDMYAAKQRNSPAEITVDNLILKNIDKTIMTSYLYLSVIVYVTVLSTVIAYNLHFYKTRRPQLQICL